MRVAGVFLVVAVAGCSFGGNTTSASLASDGAPVTDGSDEVAADSAAPPRDSARPPDLSRPPDFATPPDFAPSSPCGAVPTGGVCVGEGRVDRCVVPTGQGTASVVSKTCQTYERCQVTGGVADCVLRPGRCAPGTSACVGADRKTTCDGSGNAIESACPQCQDSGLGASCAGASTVAYAGSLNYEARGPNSTLTGWSATPFLATAPGVLVVSYRWDDGAQTYRSVSSTVTDGAGRFTLAVPSPAAAKDALVFWAVKVKPTGIADGLSYAVAIPDVPDGQWSVGTPIPGGADAGFWAWSYPIATLSQNATTTIHEADGSGALRVFDNLRYAFGSTSRLFGKDGLPLLIWLRPNTSWSCGACNLATTATLGGFSFPAQIFLPATAQDTSYWSDAVTLHEIGHWVNRSFGTSPNEGGPHTVGCPTYPGQAWSEGWATGFSSLARANSRYFDKQNGSFFWLDIGARRYSGATKWQAPTPAGGLLQLMDENEVSAMLWGMGADTGDAAKSLTSNKSFFDAMASARLNASPFARGYTTHHWVGSCAKSNVVDTGASAPMVADFLDALLCGGFDAARVDAATQPATRYPYSSSDPICP